MKGYYNGSAYMGWIPTENRYKEFETYNAYIEYYRSLFN